ncbi:hydroxymethylbilane synthase [Dietzia kunjamensis subsp. schimae]|uniref:Porphobilinogen deaminase n=1 Tax=Dietzia kunjamensis subsp. schimae TaxID=498198 RepID=A0ABY1N0F6_9ACTN|nr:hydroxymethylbilane synthase [Dietzia kunjamensis]SMO66163.1 hydroxymethylbilane synthase [Dietzia kunjamensis subsp. schimae]
MSRTLKVGTRGSTLATTQAGHVRDALIAAGYPAELVIVRTRGDVVMAPVERIGVGVFTLELRAALERGDCDIAVHSYKDLPTAPDDRFAPIAVPPRVDPSDVLIARDGLTMATLPEGARVGTSAPRRRSQLAALRPDLDLHPLRGNIDTRMGYVTSGDLDAVVLAAAGLDRTGVGERATHRFGIDEMLPAPAQGALAVECRADDTEAAEALTVVDHLPSRVRITAERRLLRDLEAGCTAPVGARAELDGAGLDSGGELTLHAVAASHDGSTVLRTHGTTATADHPDGPIAAADELGRRLAAELLDRGARDLMAAEPPEHRAPLVPRESTTAPPTVTDP